MNPSIPETSAARLAAMADPKLRAAPERLQDALHAAATVSVLHRQILGLFLARLELIEDQMEILDKSIGEALHGYHDAVLRLAEVPGYGIDSAQQVIAEIGPAAATFPSAAQLSSRVGTCPGREEIGRSLPEKPQAEGQPDDATGAQPSGQCCSEDEGQRIPGGVSPLTNTTWP